MKTKIKWNGFTVSREQSQCDQALWTYHQIVSTNGDYTVDTATLVTRSVLYKQNWQ